MKSCICRVIGNELPPKDSPGDRIKSLELVLEMDKAIDADKFWLLNRIIDSRYLKEVKAILKDSEYLEIAFEKHEYKITFDKLHYVTNINPARNELIKHYRDNYDNVYSLDQDCFFLKDMWEGIQKFITINPRPYYGLLSKRITDLNKIWNEPDNEAMLVFTRQSEILFDETIRFGENDKRALLKQLGYTSNWSCLSTICATAGNVLHIGYDDQIEKDINHRLKIRQLGLDNLLKRANDLMLFL